MAVGRSIRDVPEPRPYLFAVKPPEKTNRTGLKTNIGSAVLKPDNGGDNDSETKELWNRNA